MIYYLLALIVLGIDQVSKYMIVKNMDIGQSITMIPDFLYITSVRNKGAAWSILEGQRLFFFIVTFVVLIIVIYYMQKIGRFRPLLGLGLAFVIAGTIGNFLDRLFRGEVVDFIHTVFGSYQFPVFNVADSSLFIGVVIIICYLLITEKKEKKNGSFK
ncbi:signal peptidase II [Terrilactibacillus laevilacticus]|uniref:Lipoprotein signal peptidase n=1 Tax=Terrilactibacillus laevilacticus TaxID=1380157 RepID=A0ABW5PQ33_9BACI|nr:signal peptidase II [Terrilactibacillus laevilacticus]